MVPFTSYPEHGAEEREPEHESDDATLHECMHILIVKVEEMWLFSSPEG